MSALRLNRLDLTRYGHFEGASLDFGPAREVDVTVVYGDNEAGKSTAFAAWLDLLYGFKDRLHPYAFRYPRADLEVGGVLKTPEGTRALRRTAKGLRDGDGNPVEALRLAAILHNLDRAAYVARFSLDDVGLREGGEAIARGSGDLGEALHVGSSGMAGAGAALDALATRADDFFTAKRRKHRLAEIRREVKAAEAEIREQALAPRGWDDLQRAVGQAEARVNEARTAMEAAGRDLTLCARAADALALGARIAALGSELANAPEGPVLPPGAEADLAAAQATRDAARARLVTLKAALERAEAGLAALPKDEAAAALAAPLARVSAIRIDGAPLRDRVAANAPDLPRRRQAMDAAKASRDAALADLGLPALPSLGRDGLDGLAAELAAAGEAQRACVRAEEALAEARDAVPDAPAEMGDAEQLRAALVALRDTNRAGEMAEAAEASREALAEATVGLPADWPDRVHAPDGLPEMAEIETLVSLSATLAERQDAARSAAAQGADAVALARADRDALAGRAELVSDAARDAAREARDAAWDRHRATLDAETADRFASLMRADDAAGLRHQRGEAERMKLRNAEEMLEIRRREAATLAKKAEQAANAVADHSARLTAMAARLGFDGADPSALAPRLRRLTAAMQADLDRRRAERLDAAAQAAREAAETRLAELLGPGTGALELRAEARLAEIAKIEAQAEARQGALDRAERATKARDAAHEASRHAQAALSRRLAGTGLEGREPPDLLAALPILRNATEAEAERRRLAERVADMEAAEDRLHAELRPLGEVGDDPVARFDALSDRLEASREASRERTRLTEAAEETRAAIAVARDEITSAEATLARVLEGQESTEISALLARDDLRREHGEAQRALDELRATHGEALEAEMTKADPARRDALAAELAAAEAEHGAALEARGAAREAMRAAEAGRGAGEARARRAALLAELAEEARAAAVARLGEMAARRALRRMGEAQRGVMLDAAQHAFARLTGGRWTRLDTAPGDKGGFELFASGTEPQTRVDRLSSGTRGQIYLALRLAGHAAFAGSHGALPFVLDDIAETFDDTRAQATLTMLGEVGRRGQAILLTHHRHLVEMARDAIPDLRVVDLPAPAGAAPRSGGA